MDQSEVKELLVTKVPFMSDILKELKEKQTNLPETSHESSKQLTVIGIIDASGSMSSWWAWLANFWNASMPKQNLVTITFDTKPRLCASNVLTERINNHGGGGTQIPEAFKMVEDEMAKIPADHNITMIFISDG